MMESFTKPNKAFVLILLAFLVVLILVFTSFKDEFKQIFNYGDKNIDTETLFLSEVLAQADLDKAKTYEQLASYLTLKLSGHGVKEVKFLRIDSISEAAKLIRENKLHIYFDSPFTAIFVNQLGGAEFLLNRWKAGVEKYHSVIFTRKDSQINNLDDLKGKIVAFDTPFSTSGYLLPKAELVKLGYVMTKKSGPDDFVSTEEIGYYFVGDDKQLVEDVKNGIAAVGAQNEAEIADIFGKDNYKKLLTSIDVFRHIIIVNKNLDSGLKAEIKRVLLDMDKTEEGREVLKKFQKTAKFTEFALDIDAAFAPIKELSKWIEEDVLKAATNRL